MTARKKPAKKATPAKPPEPKTAPDICFVIMPFGGWFDSYYEQIYTKAIERAGLEPHRGDDLYRPSTITTDIWTYTKKSKLVLADLTNKNPNVFYELGLAHALAKPAILIAESIDDVPFDLRSLRVIVYNKNLPDWGAVLSQKIEMAIKETVAAPQEAVLPAFLNLSGSTPKVTLTEREKDLLSLRQDVEALRRELPRMVSGPFKEGLPSRIDIGPEAAEQMVTAMHKGGVPEDLIVSTVKAYGPPPSWILRKLRALEEASHPLLFEAESPVELKKPKD